MEKPVYHRVLLKISGEALAGDKHSGLDFEVIGQVCDVVKKCLDMGVQVGLVAATSGGAPTTAAAAKWSGPAPITSVCWLRL